MPMTGAEHFLYLGYAAGDPETLRLGARWITGQQYHVTDRESPSGQQLAREKNRWQIVWALGREPEAAHEGQDQKNGYTDDSLRHVPRLYGTAWPAVSGRKISPPRRILPYNVESPSPQPNF